MKGPERRPPTLESERLPSALRYLSTLDLLALCAAAASAGPDDPSVQLEVDRLIKLQYRER